MTLAAYPLIGYVKNIKIKSRSIQTLKELTTSLDCNRKENEFHPQMLQLTKEAFQQYLSEFRFDKNPVATRKSSLVVNGRPFPVFSNEFWTPKQRQANALHEVSYRACFKPQLPRFFINLFTTRGDKVYDPFNGRGTTIIEAALLGRNIIANDINPLSLILSAPRIAIPSLNAVEERLTKLPVDKTLKSDIDLSMFFERKTLAEIVSLKNYLRKRNTAGKEDDIDRWIRMVATNRLTGHSNGFFSVYTLPPNQAMSAERQKKTNKIREQKPEYRDTKKLILKKSRILMRDIDEKLAINLNETNAKFINGDAGSTKEIRANSVSLTVTSPPFLDVVQYADDNWMRCWFNGIDIKKVAAKITMSKTVEEWGIKMQQVFNELYRITKKGGIVAFEVGEVRNGKIKLEEVVIPLGLNSGFECDAVLINEQQFTKTANIWGVNNNTAGTNSNRIVVFRKI
jgi:DNA modification methylase